MSRVIVLCAALVIAFAAFITYSLVISDVPTPEYRVIKSAGPIEIRRYPKVLVAEVEVQGSQKQAIGEGFKLLADYIFGNNLSTQTIDMTAPVTQGEKVAMTAPVQQTQLENNRWVIQFFMPPSFTKETLPTPNNEQVKISERPGLNLISIRFSGMASASNFNKHQKKLEAYIEKEDIDVAQGPIYAYYNPPWTFPWLKRNEIHFILKETRANETSTQSNQDKEPVSPQIKDDLPKADESAQEPQTPRADSIQELVGDGYQDTQQAGERPSQRQNDATDESN